MGALSCREERNVQLLATRFGGRWPRQNLSVQHFDGRFSALVVGERVRLRIRSHERWGVMGVILGWEDVGASVDAGYIDSPSGSPRALPHEYPAVGGEMDAVVQEIDQYQPPLCLRLTLREADLYALRLPCGFCAQPAAMSPGGDGVSISVRSTDGPGSTSFVAHRSCLADRLHARFEGERARVIRVGHGGP